MELSAPLGSKLEAELETTLGVRLGEELRTPNQELFPYPCLILGEI